MYHQWSQALLRRGPALLAHIFTVLQAVSIVYFTDSWRPDSFYPRIAANRQRGLHTLCLLDIKVKEPSLESLARGRKVCIQGKDSLWSQGLPACT